MKLERNILFAFLLLAAVFPLLVSDQYVLHIGILVLFYAVLATSLNLVMGYVGEFSLGHTAFLGIGAYAAAILSLRLGLPMWATVPLAGLISAVFGVLIGAITLRLQGPFFVIVTLAFAEVLRLVADNWIGLTNGPMGLAGVPNPPPGRRQSTCSVSNCTSTLRSPSPPYRSTWPTASSTQTSGGPRSRCARTVMSRSRSASVRSPTPCGLRAGSHAGWSGWRLLRTLHLLRRFRSVQVLRSWRP